MANSRETMHPERITYQQISKAYAKHNKLTIQQRKAFVLQLSCPIKSCFEKKFLLFNGFANQRTKTHLSVTVAVGRDGKIRIG